LLRAASLQPDKLCDRVIHSRYVRFILKLSTAQDCLLSARATDPFD
jgi:hypothetical protein